MYCGNCGTKISGNMNQCPNCGMYISSMGGGSGRKGAKQNSGTMMLIGGIVALVAIITVLFLVLVVKMDKQEREVIRKNTEQVEVIKKTEEPEVYPEIPEFIDVVASSTLPNALKYTYYAENVMDKNRKTAWNEGATGAGIGETLTFSAREKQKVSGITILNGYCQDSKTYYNNNRVKTIRIWFSDGTSYEHIIHDVFDEYTNIEFSEGKICDTVVLTIMDVYKGAKYDDTCISEIEFY